MPLDASVGLDSAGQIFQAALHPKSFVALDSADHPLSRPADAQLAADMIAAWARRYLQVGPDGEKPTRDIASVS